ncbi:hypothetical protein [Ectopseudomonas toyotomiensis]|uniref:hypothetical protein n=1 Tax=Ectopseudomonas toyotomiensis TaxID=554344 RepID=UPI003D140DDA
MLIVGCAVTALWLFGLGFVVFVNLDKAIALELNAWGDFLAGGFAPLAFFWLVIGYFQQGRELRLSTSALRQQEKALMLQVAELRESVKQQQALVQAAKEDIELGKSAMKIQLEKEKASAQPIPEVQITSRTNEGDYRAHHMRIFNIGPSASHVFVEEKASDFFASGELNRPSSRWGGDNYLFVKVHIPVYLDADMVGHICLNISYVDGFGVREKVSIGLGGNGLGGLKVVELKQPD